MRACVRACEHGVDAWRAIANALRHKLERLRWHFECDEVPTRAVAYIAMAYIAMAHLLHAHCRFAMSVHMTVRAPLRSAMPITLTMPWRLSVGRGR